MSKKIKKESENEEAAEIFEFSLENPVSGSSGSVVKPPAEALLPTEDLRLAPETGESDDLPVDPIFKLLAEPKLPSLPKADRAKLQMQSPNRIHFYWSVKTNPYSVLDKALGGRTGSYTLVAKLKNVSTGAEKIFPIDAKGDWWFDVESDSLYRCEIGFYAPNRPYVRVAYSNELRTPRKKPSQRTDYTPSFAANADQFALALDAAGYKKDAFDVTLAGDDPRSAHRATHRSYAQLTGKEFTGLGDDFDSDLRLVLLALAAGYSLAEIEDLVDPLLFAAVKNNLAGVSADRALKSLEEHFDIAAEEVEIFEESAPRVFGSSLVNFPRRLTKRRMPRKLVPKIDELKELRSVSSPVRI
ncbi:MAG: DUF4912 domain-containing protein [Acidobacteriota bacterium]|nr:DUF4912 domain-containing protein [Acidobacteriota bacterium]MDH3528672.1 DUF4912 domain-containing protein [Acidobacteriota bacterium]